METTSLLLRQEEENFSDTSIHHNGDNEDEKQIKSVAAKDLHEMGAFDICAILSTAFSYGCIMSTLFLLTLPVECQRISDRDDNVSGNSINKSLALGMFAGLGGVAQLITPLIGKLSDSYENVITDETNEDSERKNHRMPYLILGSVCMLIGLVGQVFGSLYEFWGIYTIFFLIHMIGINIVYCIMIALIPDLVPQSQTGLANGTLALLLVLGSLFGFAFFYLVSTTTSSNFFTATMERMYGLYIFVTISTTILTYRYAVYRQTFIYKLQYQSDNTCQINTEDGNGLSIASHKNSNHKKQSICRLLHMLLAKPFEHTSWSEIMGAYTIDPNIYHDFFVVTVSRLFYYMAISSQTFFLYFIHDRIIVAAGGNDGNENNKSMAMVSTLAILGQATGALTCYPVGIISDKYCNGLRKPFVYFSCVILASCYIAIITCKTYHQMILCVMIAGAANGIYLTMDTSLAVDTLPANIPKESHEESLHLTSYQRNLPSKQQQRQKKNHLDGNAQLLGVWGVAGFLGTTLGPLIFAPTLLLFGYIEPPIKNHHHYHDTHNPNFGLNGYAVLFSIAAFFFICSAVTLAFVRKKGV